MTYLPLNIDMRGRRVLIVGGGRVATRKALSLCRAGADVYLVSCEISDEIAALQTAGALSLRIGTFQASDLDGVFLAITATDDPQANADMAAEARRRGILTSVTDAPRSGDCIFPAVLQRGDLQVAVSSGGSCPAFSAQVRDVIAGVIGDEYGDALERLAAEREKLLTEGNASTYNAGIVRSGAQSIIAELTGRKGTP